MDAFIWPLGKKTEHWMVWPNVAVEENCMAQSGCSESHACHVLQPKWTYHWPSCVCIMVSGQYYCSLLHAKWGQFSEVNNQNCLSMMSFCSRTMQHLITIMMCKIWCNTGARMCWHILSTLQILPHVITGCLNMWKNILGIHELNQQMISTLVPLPLYIIWASMNKELQLIIYRT